MAEKQEVIECCETCNYYLNGKSNACRGLGDYKEFDDDSCDEYKEKIQC